MTHFMKAKIKRTALYGLVFMASKWTIIFLLYHSGFWTYWFLLLFPIADSIAAVSAVIYLKGNFKKYFAQELEREFPENFKEMQAEVNDAYEKIESEAQLRIKSKNPLNKRLRFSAYFVAFIQVLEGRGYDLETIRTHCLHIAQEYIKPKNGFHRWYLKLVPSLLLLPWSKYFLKRLSEKVKIKDHPYGFEATLLTQSEINQHSGFGIDIHKCGICSLVKKNNASRYNTILCEIDHLTSELAGLQLVRTSSLAQGAAHCDFRFRTLV